jgi:hypothetical protein
MELESFSCMAPMRASSANVMSIELRLRNVDEIPVMAMACDEGRETTGEDTAH